MKAIARLLAALLVAGVGASSSVFAQTEKLEDVTLATLAPSALLWLHAIAVDQDFYTANGVKVNAVQAQSSSALAQAVSTGSADAGVALGDNVMRAIDEGAPIIMTGAILSKGILRLIGTTETVEDLAGKRITGGAVTGGTTELLLYQLLQHGVKPDQVQVVGIPNSRDRLVGFQNGQLEGGLLIAPFDILALREGYNLLDVYTGYWVETPLIVNTKWAQANPRAARGVTRAFADAAAWIYEPANRDEAVRILAEYTGIEQDIVQDAYDFIIIEQQAVSPDLTVPEEGLRSILMISQAVHGGEMPPFDFNKYYDGSYLQ